MGHERKRFILGQHPDPGQARVHDIGQAEIDNPVNPAKRYCRFRPVPHQEIQSAPDTAGQEEYKGIATFSHFSSSPSARCLFGHFSAGIRGATVQPHPMLNPSGMLLFHPITLTLLDFSHWGAPTRTSLLKTVFTSLTTRLRRTPG